MSKQLLEIEFEWGTTFTQEEVDRLGLLTGKTLKLKDDKQLEWGDHKHELTLDEVFSFQKPFSVKRPTTHARWSDVVDTFIPRVDATAPVNTKCNVIVAGTSIMEIREVEVFTDLCTVKLQKQLDAGWRILAICVQPDQRRPDYVLGRPDKQ